MKATPLQVKLRSMAHHKRKRPRLAEADKPRFGLPASDPSIRRPWIQPYRHEWRGANHPSR